MKGSESPSPGALDDDYILEEARSCFLKILESNDYKDQECGGATGAIWQENIKSHLDIIVRTAPSLRQMFDYLNRHAFYDINFGSRRLLEKATAWRHKKFFKSVPNASPSLISESTLISEDRLFHIDQHFVSSDLIWRLSILQRLTKKIDFPKETFSILEIGGGYGSLARAINTIHTNCKYTMIDLPHSLVFQYCYLKNSFPNKKHVFIANPDEVVPKDADFVYIPHKWSHLLDNKEIFLTINTNSFGEMPSSESLRYIDFIQNTIKTEYLFSLNRFLNRINNSDTSRHSCVGYAFEFDKKWDIVDWEIDPDYERCPILASLLSRNLHMILRRREHNCEFDHSKVAELLYEDWNTRLFWKSYELMSGGRLGLEFPAPMTRADRELTPDLTTTGTLFCLWDAYRLSRDSLKKHLATAIVEYLSYLSCSERQFEEVLYLNTIASEE